VHPLIILEMHPNIIPF